MTTNITALAASLDLPTRARLLTGATTFTLVPEPSIGLGEQRWSDGPTGVRGLKFSGGRVVACLPNATPIASAWSEDTADEVGGLLAEEALAQQIHVVLGPTINLHRSVLGGRPVVVSAAVEAAQRMAIRHHVGLTRSADTFYDPGERQSWHYRSAARPAP